MNETQMYILVSIGIYFLIIIALGYIASRRQTAESYIIGNRNVGTGRTMASLATTFRDGSGIVFWTGAGLTMGYGGLWLVYGLIAGLLFYSWVDPRLRQLAHERNYITIGQVIRDNIGGITRRLTAVIILIFTMMIVAMQLYVAGNVIARIIGVEHWVGICSIAFVVGCYLYWGGYGNVVKTDAVQCILIVSLIVIPFFLPPAKEQLLDFKSLFSQSLSNNVAFFLFGAFYAISCADAWQRVFAARDGKVIRLAFPGSGVIFLIMTLSLIFLGYGAKQILPAETQAGDVFFALFENKIISPQLQSFLAIIAMAITMSVTSSGSYAGASTFCKDILPEQKTADNKNYIMWMRRLIVIILISMSLVAINVSDIVQFLFNAASFLFIIMPIYILAVLDKHPSTSKDRLLTLCTLFCIACYIYLFIQGAFANLIITFFPTGFNIFCTILIYFYYKKKSHVIAY